MELTTSTTFSVTRFAPFGDSIEIKIRGFLPSLGKDDAVIIFRKNSNLLELV